MAPLFSKEIFALPGLKSVLLHRGDGETRRRRDFNDKMLKTKD
jgi:hypothetical protein